MDRTSAESDPPRPERPNRASRIRDNARLFGWRATVGQLVGKRMPGLGRIFRGPDDRFDERHGIETEGFVPVDESNVSVVSETGAEPYQPTHERVLADVLRHLPDGIERATFVDLGCGRGRALIAAAQYPFARILGIELSPAHCDVARKNIRRVLDHDVAAVRCRDIAVACGDVRSQELPEGDLFLFAFNPFRADILESLVQRVVSRESEPSASRTIHLAVINVAIDPSYLCTLGFERVLHTEPLTPWWSWSLYRHDDRGDHRLMKSRR